MIISKVGRYKFLSNYITKGSAIPESTIISVVQVDMKSNKIIGPELPNWLPWNLPVEEVIQ